MLMSLFTLFASENMTPEERLKAVFADRTNAGASEDANINRVEAELGVTLPPSYRSFLSEFGASLLVAPYEIAGIDPNRSGDAPPMFSDVVADTRRIRASAPDGVFDDLVLISSDGMSHYLYLDTSRHDDSGECPVVVIAPGIEREDVASSFVEFVESVLVGDPLASVG